MDQHSLVLLIPIAAMLIPIAAVVMHGLQKIAKLRLEEALARNQGAGAGDAGELEALRSDVAELRHELADVQERLDFTERALVQKREPVRLPGANPSE